MCKMAFFDPPVLIRQVLQSPDFREKGGVGRRFSVQQNCGNRKTSLEEMIGLQEHRRRSISFRPTYAGLTSSLLSSRSGPLSTFCLAFSLHKQWIFDGFSCLRLMISGLLESVLGENLACFNRFPKQPTSSSWIGGGDMLTSAFRNSPVGVHTQVKLICRPSNVMNRTGGCFLKHTSGWIFMKQNPLFVRFFMFDHYLILIIFFSRFSFCSNSILHDFLGGPRIWKGLETMGSNLRTLGTACSSCTAISACGLQEFGLRLSWLPCESLGERFVGWFFPCILRKILNEERFRSPESSKLQGWYKSAFQKIDLWRSSCNSVE